MRKHYYDHVIKENMQVDVKNILNYTRRGKDLWKYYSHTAKKLNSGSLKIPFKKTIGTGGIYTELGKILSVFLR
jgi:hypothetical protein